MTGTAQPGTAQPGAAERRHAISLVVNGAAHHLSVEARHTLLDTLRDECGLTGAHAGCEHGVCGACTVLLDGAAVRSCLIFAVQADGHALRTVEGLERDGTLHPLQQAFIDHHALQCGFCTPGFLMLALGLLEQDPAISDAELLHGLSSNLCRCTGYQNIVRAVRDATGKMRG